MYYCDEQLTHYNGIVILLSGLVSSSVVADAIVILFVILVCMYPNSDNSGSCHCENIMHTKRPNQNIMYTLRHSQYKQNWLL